MATDAENVGVKLITHLVIMDLTKRMGVCIDEGKATKAQVGMRTLPKEVAQACLESFEENQAKGPEETKVVLSMSMHPDDEGDTWTIVLDFDRTKWGRR
jgi:hypothetical protein